MAGSPALAYSAAVTWAHRNCTLSPPCADRTDMEVRHGRPRDYRLAVMGCPDISGEEATAAADAYDREYGEAPHRLSEEERAAALAAAVVAAGHRQAHEQLDKHAESLLSNYAYWRDQLRREDRGPVYPDDSYIERDYDQVYSELGARRFHLVRDVDVSGVSGTGTVAVGVVFANGSAAGRVAVHWLTNPRSTGLFGSAEDAAAIHGHGGSTRLAFLDEPAPPEGPAPLRAVPLAPSGGAVELLEGVLADARRGHVRSVAFATVSTERCVGTGYHLEERAGLEPHALVGALERLKVRILTTDGSG